MKMPRQKVLFMQAAPWHVIRMLHMRLTCVCRKIMKNYATLCYILIGAKTIKNRLESVQGNGDRL
jgi:hypothetical protein